MIINIIILFSGLLGLSLFFIALIGTKIESEECKKCKDKGYCSICNNDKYNRSVWKTIKIVLVKLL
jgi:hypothetical protein